MSGGTFTSMDDNLDLDMLGEDHDMYQEPLLADIVLGEGNQFRNPGAFNYLNEQMSPQPQPKLSPQIERAQPPQVMDQNGTNNMTMLSQPPSNSILRAALTKQQNNVPQPMQGSFSMMNQQQQGNSFPNDFDLNTLSLDCLEGLDCDVSEVIKHELNVDGSLDCNFDSISNLPGSNNMNAVH
jgi:hypothetical protein